MNLKAIQVNNPGLGVDWGHVTGRVWFVDVQRDERIGYFVPLAARDDRDSCVTVSVDFETRAAFGGLEEPTEFWTPDGRTLLGLFIPETDATRERYARFEATVTDEEMDYSRHANGPFHTTAEVLANLTSPR